MSLSVASDAAGSGRPLGYVLTGLSAVVPAADATRRSGASSSWSYSPMSIGVGRGDARMSDVMAVLSRLSADPDAIAAARSGQGTGDPAGSASGKGPGRSDAADLLQALNHHGGVPAVTAHLPPVQGSPEPDQQPLQALVQQTATDAVPDIAPSMQEVPPDPSISAADAQLQALFKTLQEYGL